MGEYVFVRLNDKTTHHDVKSKGYSILEDETWFLANATSGFSYYRINRDNEKSYHDYDSIIGEYLDDPDNHIILPAYFKEIELDKLENEYTGLSMKLKTYNNSSYDFGIPDTTQSSLEVEKNDIKNKQNILSGLIDSVKSTIKNNYIDEVYFPEMHIDTVKYYNYLEWDSTYNFFTKRYNCHYYAWILQDIPYDDLIVETREYYFINHNILLFPKDYFKSGKYSFQNRSPIFNPEYKETKRSIDILIDNGIIEHVAYNDIKANDIVVYYQYWPNINESEPSHSAIATGEYYKNEPLLKSKEDTYGGISTHTIMGVNPTYLNNYGYQEIYRYTNKFHNIIDEQVLIKQNLRLRYNLIGNIN